MLACSFRGPNPSVDLIASGPMVGRHIIGERAMNQTPWWGMGETHGDKVRESTRDSQSLMT